MLTSGWQQKWKHLKTKKLPFKDFPSIKCANCFYSIESFCLLFFSQTIELTYCQLLEHFFDKIIKRIIVTSSRKKTLFKFFIILAIVEECAENALKMNNREHINNGDSTIPLFE